MSRKVQKAAQGYENFSGHAARGTRRVPYTPFTTGWPLGKLDAVMYSTVRDGKREKYIHRFKSTSRPLLVVNPDGSALGIVGGRYRVTESGINDV